MRVLILVPHLDDLELGCSVYLEHLARRDDTTVDVITFCRGRDHDNFITRENKFKENLKIWEERGVCINPFYPEKLYRDTELTSGDLNSLCKEVLSLSIPEYDEVLIPQADLHSDHVIINTVGKILTRDKHPSVMEYIILNSFPIIPDQIRPIWNTEYRLNARTHPATIAWSVCKYPTELDETKINRQKLQTDGFITDRMNQIKKVII